MEYDERESEFDIEDEDKSVEDPVGKSRILTSRSVLQRRRSELDTEDDKFVESPVGKPGVLFLASDVAVEDEEVDVLAVEPIAAFLSRYCVKLLYHFFSILETLCQHFFSTFRTLQQHCPNTFFMLSLH